MDPREADDHDLGALAALVDAEPARLVERVLRTARETLAMEISYFSELRADEQVIRAVDGEDSFGFEPGTRIPLADTYCRRMLAGEIPSAVGDAQSHECLAELRATADADIGAYIGVPLVLPDGRVYGTLCCASHVVHPQLGDRDVRFLQVLSRLLADDIALDELRRAASAHAERGARIDRALALNERLTQQLVMARYHLDADRREDAAGCLDAALAEAHRASAELLPDDVEPGALRLPSRS